MRVLIQCDGGGSLGVGHVMRSLALAEAAVAAGHEVMVAGHFEGAFLQGQLAAAPVEVVELELEPQSELMERFGPDVIHVDSYDTSWWIMGSFVVSNMEDGLYGRRSADVVIDPTFGAELTPRPDDDTTTAGLLLRGSRYTPIRQRVLDARAHVAASPRMSIETVDTIAHSVAHSVLVVMGGSDPVGLAPVAVGLLARTGLALDVTVVATGENVDRARLAAAESRLTLNILAPVDDLPALMARQDLVVSAAGTSVWELCCLGVPMAVIWAVDNQRAGYDRVVGAGAALGLGGPGLREMGPGSDAGVVHHLRTALTDSQVRADLVRAGRHIVDGLGAWRVVRTWEQAVRQSQRQASSPDRPSAAALVPRPATVEDARLLWQWRNDPATRAGSRHSEAVPWADHLTWVGSSLTRQDRLLLIVEDDMGPVGTVRWDLEQDTDLEGGWEVSITVAPDRRGRSLARPLLRAGELALSEMTRPEGEGARASRVTAYLAVVRVDNGASMRLFETSAYVPDLPPDAGGFMRLRKAAPVA